jgi:FKBP-type peptidyl-prolyl cis-trans isomerase
VKSVISILAGLILVSSQAIFASEDLAGLNYYNEIDKEEITTSSGLQYKVLIMGKGRKPIGKKKIKVHYRGIYLDGTTFDSSYHNDEPLELGMKQIIKGWSEGVQLMPVGSVFIFLIPPELAYGSKGRSSIPPDTTLIFEIELFGYR